MKYGILFLVVALLHPFLSISQTGPNDLSRLVLNPDLAPFYHGVASGDPLSDAVIIWTRVTTQDPGDISVNWKMATDTLFINVVGTGAAVTNSSKDHTVKVDVTGLQPAVYYYFQFEYQGRKSLIGRTKTAPIGDVDHLRFAVVSCSDFENGYFNAYEHIALRNDFDAVLHLGDYIYEYGVGGLTNTIPGRENEPQHEIITLTDYRVRYSHYRLDPQLRSVHQQYPFITTWDDHETANNSWFGGAGNHDPNSEGDWFVRKDNGRQAYFEWLPVRVTSSDSLRIYRKYNYSDLADVIVLDTRLEGRDEQGGTTNQSPTRTILGQDQYNWLVGNLHDTTTQWKIIAQQVMMAPLGIGALTFNEDQWDGYPAERQRLFDEIRNNNIKNFVVTTGDIHTSWANELTLFGQSSAGVEFVTPSITTSNADIAGIGFDPSFLFPHVEYANLNAHGYLMLDINKNRAQSDWVFVNTISQIDTSASVDASWYVNDGERTLNEAQSPASGLTSAAPLAPFTVENPPTSVVINEPEVIIIGSYPNPFWADFIVQYYLQTDNERVKISLITLAGKVLHTQEVYSPKGVNYLKVDASIYPAGQYVLVFESQGYSYTRNVIKVN